MDTPPPTQADDSQRALIARSLPCARCGYDLRGLHVASLCPECGLRVSKSVQSVVDPTAHRLPVLRNARGVGRAVLWLMACLVSAVLLLVARSVTLRIQLLDLAGGSVVTAPRGFIAAAGACVWLALVSVWLLAPPRREESDSTVVRDVWRLGVGLLLWGVFAFALWLYAREAAAGGRPSIVRQIEESGVHLLTAGGLIVTMIPLGSIFKIIGERSREYRTARGSRQRAREMVVAAMGIAVGEGLRLGGVLSRISALETLGTVFVWICTLMVMIGLVYLLVNAWWISRSLRRPPPTLAELLMPEPAPVVDEEDEERRDDEDADA